MRISRWTPVLLVTCVGLIACGQEAEQQQAQAEKEAAAEQKAEGAKAGGEEVSVTLSPKNESGIQGTAVVARQADSISVRMMLGGLEPGASYPAHVHEGTCETGGGVATALTKISADDSTGTSATTFAASAVSPDSAYFLQAHLPDGTPAACGDVPAAAFGSSGGM